MITYKTQKQIELLNDQEFIKYAQSVNIDKAYTFDAFIETKQHILEEVQKRNIDLQEILPKRFIGDKVIKKLLNNI